MPQPVDVMFIILNDTTTYYLLICNNFYFNERALLFGDTRRVTGSHGNTVDNTCSPLTG